MACVYWIRLPEHNDMSSQGYIGFTSLNANERWKQHIRNANKPRRKDYPLYHAMRKYRDKALFSVLLIGNAEYCLAIEQKLRAQPYIGWNICIGGDANQIGIKRSQETRDKLSRAQANRIYSESMREKCRAATLGRKHTPESIEKMRTAQKGKLIGRKLSEETKRKIGLAGVGRKFSSTSRNKISESLKKLRPWERVMAIKEVWMQAEEIKHLLDEGEPRAVLARRLFGRHSQLETMALYFKGGWEPAEDAMYQKWKAENQYAIKERKQS